MLPEQNQWFVSWFNSPYYHLLYKNRDEWEAEFFIDRIIDFLKPLPGSRILDLACGKGRHSVYLNKKGFDVTGIDLSEQSINSALQHSNDTLHFFVHDMRLPCRINYFDYVFNLFTSFGYFENERDNQSTVNAILKSLRPKGVVVIDFMNAKKVIATMKKSETKTVENVVFNIKRKVENNFIIKQISFEDKGKHYFFEERVSALLLADFEGYLASGKLKILNLFGDYSLSNFNEETSDRLIIVAQKQ